MMSSGTERDRDDCISSVKCILGDEPWLNDMTLDHVKVKPNNEPSSVITDDAISMPTVSQTYDDELERNSEETVASVPTSLPPDIISSSFGVDLTSTFDEFTQNLQERDNSVMVLKPSHLDRSSSLTQFGRLRECDAHNQLGNLDQLGYPDHGCKDGYMDQSPDLDNYRKESEETLAEDLEEFVTNTSKLSLPAVLDGLDRTSHLPSECQAKTSSNSKQTASVTMEKWTLQDLSKEIDSGKLTHIYAVPKVEDNKAVMSGTASTVSAEICQLMKQSELCTNSVIGQPCEQADPVYGLSYGVCPNMDICSEQSKEEHSSLPERLLTEKIGDSLAGFGTGSVESFSPVVLEQNQEEGDFKSESTAVCLATVGKGKAESGERTSLCCVRSQESLIPDMSSELVKEDGVTVDGQLTKDDVFGSVLQDDVVGESLKDDAAAISGSQKDSDEKVPLPVSVNDVLYKNIVSAATCDKSATESNNTHVTSMEEHEDRKARKNKAHLTDSASKTDSCIVTSAMSFAAPCSASLAVAQSASPRTSSTTFLISSLSSSTSSSNEVPHNVALSPPLSSNINVPITQLGKVAPSWLPDSEASRCMQCETPFSFTRRRHHCRACGKIFCGSCSSLKAALKYLENKESRVCSKCYQDLIRAKYYQQTHRKSQSRPNPNNPSEYCSLVSPLLQIQSMTPAPLPSIMVPTTGVLRKQGSIKSNTEAKQVMFADGIRPGGDLTEADGVSSVRLAPGHTGRRTKRVERTGPAATTGDVQVKPVLETKQSTCLIPTFGGLPPIVIASSSSSSSSLSQKRYSLLDSPTVEFVLHHLHNAENPQPLTFAVDHYLAVIVSIIRLDCCMHRTCWSFTTKGMRNVGQDELVILLEYLPEERILPLDVFHHLHLIYQQASQGNPVLPMCHTVLPAGAFSSLDYGGFLFIRRTFQCREKLILPEPPYLFGILLQKWEMSWAKVFPLRLLFRLGAEFRYYPCPLVGIRNRRPVYGEIGHTIMNLLADFHNFQYMVPQINGLVIRLEDKKATIKIPCIRYDAVMKVLNSANDHVLALGADFCVLADSHLVCIQNEDGNYQTQAINIQNKPCKVTGASFVVFNGALKPASGVQAKWSIVEDGVMVQVTPSAMMELKQSWKEMKNYTINCSNSSLNSTDEVVTIEWIDDKDFFTLNVGVKSPVDGQLMQGTESRRIHSANDFSCEGHVIRWTEIFLSSNELGESANMSRFTESLAQSACLALVSHAPLLTQDLMTNIGLRITIGLNEMSFKAGSNGRPLPEFCICDLEEKLMPLLQKFASSLSSLSGCQGNIVFELILQILHMSSTIANTPCIVLSD